MKQPSGILLLNKRQGVTSAKAIAEVKHKLGIKKIGHAGTLDPMATGLLICLVNDATKLAELFQKSTKVYTGTILLGVRTTTDDIEGDVIKRTAVQSRFEEIKAASRKFVGLISQIPPQISAVHVNGKRAYTLAREGVEVKLTPRQVEISEFQIWPHKDSQIGFKITCTSGTYIRSIARDLGQALGCGGTLSSLKREESDPFTIDEASTLEELSLDHIFSVNQHCNEESCSCHL